MGDHHFSAEQREKYCNAHPSFINSCFLLSIIFANSDLFPVSKKACWSLDDLYPIRMKRTPNLPWFCRSSTWYPIFADFMNWLFHGLKLQLAMTLAMTADNPCFAAFKATFSNSWVGYKAQATPCLCSSPQCLKGITGTRTFYRQQQHLVFCHL